MLTFIELLIGVVVIVGVARYIIKGYSARLQQATAPRISLNTLKYY